MNDGKMVSGFLGALLAVATIVAGFGIAAVGINIPGEGEGGKRHGGVLVWTDPKTGCRYTSAEQGMSPLLGPDGKPDCARRQ
ncbi:hypothetical protein C0214_27185 (plasmid) [Methylobacterium sp. DM1]|nr:hypothetical protein C0214_27185 [Methylobacterium sp. DM1]